MIAQRLPATRVPGGPRVRRRDRRRRPARRRGRGRDPARPRAAAPSWRSPAAASCSARSPTSSSASPSSAVFARQPRLVPGRRPRPSLGRTSCPCWRWPSVRPRSWPASSASRCSRCWRPTTSARPAPSGCPRRRIYLSHALPNAVTATLTLGGMLLASMIAGTVLVENVFAWPGLGSTIVAVDRDQGLPGGAGHRPRLRARRARHQHRWSTSRSPCSTRVPRSVSCSDVPALVPHLQDPGRHRRAGPARAHRARWRSSPRSCGATRPVPSTPRTCWPARRRSTGSAPTTWAATCSSGCSSPPGSR